MAQRRRALSGRPRAVEGRVLAVLLRTTGDPKALLYGAVVSPAVLVAVGAHAEDYRSVTLSTIAVVLVFWLAHVYVGAQVMQIDGDRRHVLHRVRAASRHESGLLKGAIPAIAVYDVSVLLGSTKQDASTLAAWFSVGLLTALGWLTARQAGLRGGMAALDAAVAGMLGVLVILLKAFVH